jgi:GH25 family lysozyme M1 (1,4-beta-N-acetylmuramidase)
MTIRANVVDLYHGDRVADFSLAKAAGLVGVIHKASQGAASSAIDPMYAVRKKRALAVGLLWGAYHFMTNYDPHDQVFLFMRAAFPETLGEPDKTTLLALDFEPFGLRTPTLEILRAMLEEIEQKCGRKAVIYSGNLIKEQLGDKPDDYLESHRLWLAEYAEQWSLKPMTAWQKPWLWQYTGDGVGPTPHSIAGIPGSGGKVDLNFYDGPDDQLRSEWAG